MAKFVRILAASIGGGMALGFGMRSLSQTAQKRRENGLSPQNREQLDARIEMMEQRLAHLEHRERDQWQPGASPSAAERIALVESRPQRSCEQIREDAEKRIREAAPDKAVLDRLEKLEATVAAQSSDLRELHEYSLISERNIQRLLVGIDRLISFQQEAAPGGSGSAETTNHRALASPSLT